MGSPSSPSITFVVTGSLARTELPALRARISALLAGSRAQCALCDVGGLEADAVAVEALVGLQLVARRRGLRMRLRGASPESFLELVGFMGLSEVLAAE